MKRLLLLFVGLCALVVSAQNPNAEEAFNLAMTQVNAGQYTEAIPNFRAAADAGYAPAMVWLGFCYYQGNGVERSYPEAFKWFESAAARGDKDGQYNIARMYERGEGVKQNYAEAERWYGLAAAQGDAQAADGMERARQKRLAMEQAAADSLARVQNERYAHSIEGLWPRRGRLAVDAGYTLGMGSEPKLDRIDASVSYGYQVATNVRLGAGVGVNYFSDLEKSAIPIFALVRFDLPSMHGTKPSGPFVELRAGYAAGDMSGLYMSPSVGYRLGLSPTMGLNIGVGYTLLKYKYDFEYLNAKYDHNFNLGGLSFRVGVEF